MASDDGWVIQMIRGASAARDVLILLIGLVIVAAAILVGPKVAAMISTESPVVMTSISDSLIFGPIAAVALTGGWVTGCLPVAGVRPGRWAAVGLACGITGLLIAAGYGWLAGSAVSRVAGTLQPGPFLAGIAIIAAQVACEELFFRGWMQPLTARTVGPVAAIAVTTAVFAAFHILGGSRAPLTLLNLLFGGVWFGLLAWRSGGLLAPIAAHFGWNASEQLLMGLDPNPGIGDFGALFDWDLVGASLWGGSDEGLNGSIAMTFVLIALIVPLAWRVPREPKTVVAAPN